MKVVILAGGLGSRLMEETVSRPKPMVEIGGKPMLWHIMKIFASQGFNEFIVALGYKGEMIKDYFLSFYHHTNDLTVHLVDGAVQVKVENRIYGGDDWTVHLVDTGALTQTGGRLKRLTPWIGSETFMMTYGDGVADIDLKALLALHHFHKRMATMTVVQPKSRFGMVRVRKEDDSVLSFEEKPDGGDGLINGGFFVIEPSVLPWINGDETPWEHHLLRSLAEAGMLTAYNHDKFWQSMDTLRDVKYLEELWQSGHAPWKVW